MIIGSEVTKTYTGEPILEKIDFKIGNARKIGVVGKNGCGKTTLFKLIVGELYPDSGSVQIQQETIAYLPQELIFPSELVGEYLEKMLGRPVADLRADLISSVGNGSEELVDGLLAVKDKEAFVGAMRAVIDHRIGTPLSFDEVIIT